MKQIFFKQGFLSILCKSKSSDYFSYKIPFLLFDVCVQEMGGSCDVNYDERSEQQAFWREGKDDALQRLESLTAVKKAGEVQDSQKSRSKRQI